MFPSTTSGRLTSSSHLLAATWENALLHFRCALLECGSPLDIEHSQRLGLLFSNSTGSSNELKRWASIFDAEDVPATALILKALVSHGQWQTAVKLLDLNRDSGVAGELSEVLGQCLVSRGLWQQTLQLAEFLPRCRAEETSRDSSLTPRHTSVATAEELNDSYQMAVNSAFLPEEEKLTYCGFISAVARAYPSKRDWKKAVKMVHDLEQLLDRDTKKKLYEYRIARLVHDGKAYRDVIEKGRCEVGFRTSPSLLRSLLRCAIATNDICLTFSSLELLCAFGSTAISVKQFESACHLLLSSHETWTRKDLFRFETLLCEKASLVKDRKLQKLIAAFCADYDLKIPIFLSSIAMPVSPSNAALPPSFANSVTNLDRLASTLVSQSRWEEALQVATLIRKTAAQSDNERIIVDMLRGGCSSWVKTLQFFTL
ncbi:hypothetical protein LSCM1_02549 [Leishmania martiniquensis]|uniref:Uncharacterized protein n=1 Tax=Leishmania martiniquensis TaxID=1580590 RepID=A0A836G9W2_9TRYP|nr:hypothetical protein LSCM1_02549 [Leishmania martiniquensis]